MNSPCAPQSIGVSIFALFISISITGCDNTPTPMDDLITYQTRLANVMDTTPLSLPRINMVPLPAKRDVIMSIEPIKMGVLSAYDQFHTCGLFQLIAERNSILGKVKDEFALIEYNIAFKQALDHCVTQLNEETIQAEFRRILEHKITHFPLYQMNALVGSDAWRRSLNVEQVKMMQSTEGDYIDVIIAIEQFGSLTIDNQDKIDIIELQKTLSDYPFLGRLFYSVTVATHYLDTISSQLKRDINALHCGQGRDNTKVTYLVNVFERIFKQSIHPQLAYFNNILSALQPTFIQFNTQFPEVMNAEYFKHYFHPMFISNYKKAIRAHVDVWFELSKKCNVNLFKNSKV